MAAISIGIDLCHNPLRVCCNVAGLFLIQEGSKGANLNVGGQEKSGVGFEFQTRDVVVHSGGSDEIISNQEEDTTAPANMDASSSLVHCFEDARGVAKSFFGSSKIKNAVVVVPNGTNDNTCRFVEAAGNRSFIDDVQVIPEHIAVAAAYAYKTKPTKTSTITIISSTSGVCDVYVVSIVHKSGMSYMYKVENHETQRGVSDHEIIDDMKKLEGTFTSLRDNIAYSLSPAFVDAYVKFYPSKDKLDIPVKGMPAFEKVVFVGKSEELKKIREIITKGFILIKEWNEPEDSEQLVAYGAAVLAWLGEPISICNDLF